MCMVHKYHGFLWEFQEIKRIEITEIRIVDANETNQNIINESQHDKTNKTICAPSEDSDQPGHLRTPGFFMQTANILIRWTDGMTDKHDVYRRITFNINEIKALQCVEGKSE